MAHFFEAKITKNQKFKRFTTLYYTEFSKELEDNTNTNSNRKSSTFTQNKIVKNRVLALNKSGSKRHNIIFG